MAERDSLPGELMAAHEVLENGVNSRTFDSSDGFPEQLHTSYDIAHVIGAVGYVMEADTSKDTEVRMRRMCVAFLRVNFGMGDTEIATRLGLPNRQNVRADLEWARRQESVTLDEVAALTPRHHRSADEIRAFVAAVAQNDVSEWRLSETELARKLLCDAGQPDPSPIEVRRMGFWIRNARNTIRGQRAAEQQP